jgi:hypothetical protein
MAAGETELKMATRHVAMQEKIITGQEAHIEHLRKVGVPVDDALRWLGTMRDLLETMRAHVARISK